MVGIGLSLSPTRPKAGRDRSGTKHYPGNVGRDTICSRVSRFYICEMGCMLGRQFPVLLLTSVVRFPDFEMGCMLNDQRGDRDKIFSIFPIVLA